MRPLRGLDAPPRRASIRRSGEAGSKARLRATDPEYELGKWGWGHSRYRACSELDAQSTVARQGHRARLDEECCRVHRLNIAAYPTCEVQARHRVAAAGITSRQ